MATVIIKRVSELNNLFRRFDIYLDNERVVLIGDGQVKEIPTNPGEHTIQARIDWCGSESIPFKIEEDRAVKFEVSGFRYGGFLGLSPVFLVLIYLAVDHIAEISPWWTALPAILAFLYVGYYLTWGRMNYLRLKKLN